VNHNNELGQLARLFLRLGITAFGGPAAHIAMMQQEFVGKRKWFTEQHFLDLIGATNLIPGPNSTEIAMHIGHERAGWKGLIVAGLCFIMPAITITGVFAWLYKRYGQLPQVQPFIYGIQPAIIAVILAAVYPLAIKSLKTFELAIIGTGVLVLSLLNFQEIYLLFGAGLFAVLILIFKKQTTNGIFFIPFLQIPGITILSVNLNLFLIFLKIGAILYGSGYVLFAFLDTELVSRGLLTRNQLTDAIAAGQITPGPVFSSVTFIGYQINGWAGAIVSTIAIFLPAFVFVALLNPLVKRMRNSKLFSAFLDAVNIASIGLIIAVCYDIGKESINDWRTILIGIISLVLTFGFKMLNSAWIVLLGSLGGYLLTFV
jgi:chromate transporter